MSEKVQEEEKSAEEEAETKKEAESVEKAEAAAAEEAEAEAARKEEAEAARKAEEAASEEVEAEAAEKVEEKVEAKEASEPKTRHKGPKKGLMERRESFSQTSVPNAHKGYNPKTAVVMLGIIVIFFVTSFILAALSS